MNKNTARLLEQHFDTAFAAPDGITKLRELILTLAMQGKLVEQDPNDPPASKLLQEIEAEKQRLVKTGKIKKPKPLPPIKPAEVPYQLPRGWEWVRLGNIGLVGSSSRVHQRDWRSEGVPFYRAREIVKLSNLGFVENELFISENHYATLAKDGLTPEVNDVMITGVGTIGVPYIVKETDRFYFKDASVLIFKNFYRLYAPFLFRFFKSPYWIERIHDGSMGTTVHTLTIGRANEIFVPLPPLPEQHRIVARIDQLMARCDALEKLRKEREERRLAVHAAAIKQLLDAPGGVAWDFIEQHFGELYTVKENVAELRKAILQLAVMGRLVPPNPNDPPASKLLKEIEAEKQRLVKAGKIKKPKPLPPIKPEEVPYELPQGWEWVRLGELIELISGQHLTPDEYNENGIGHSYYTGPADFGAINPCATRWTTVDRSMAIKGDILLTVKGAGVGKTNVLAEEMAAISRQLMALRVVRVNRDYVLRFLGTIFYELQALAVGIAIPGIGRDDVLLRKFPLPPLSEQHRVVARIDQLMALCDTLERQIDAATGKQDELLNAVMAQ